MGAVRIWPSGARPQGCAGAETTCRRMRNVE